MVAVARRLATCAATGAGGEQQPGRDAHVCACGCANRCLGAAHRGSRRIAREGARHARERPARRPLPSASAPAADHAAALWQLCCRIGRTTTVACQRVGSYARGHHLPRATGARRGVNNGAAQRAGDGSRVYPAIRHHLWIRTRSSVRRLTIQRPTGAAFGGRDADGHPQGSICRVWAHSVRRSASRGARERKHLAKTPDTTAGPRRAFALRARTSSTRPSCGHPGRR